MQTEAQDLTCSFCFLLTLGAQGPYFAWVQNNSRTRDSSESRLLGFRRAVEMAPEIGKEQGLQSESPMSASLDRIF